MCKDPEAGKNLVHWKHVSLDQGTDVVGHDQEECGLEPEGSGGPREGLNSIVPQ